MSHNYNHWANQSGSYYQGMPQVPGRQPYSFNPNANTFVPRQQRQQQGYLPQQLQQNIYSQHNTYDYQPPSYANAQMYGGQQQQQYNNYNNYGGGMNTYYPEQDFGVDQFGFPQQQQYVASSDLREQHQKSENYKEIAEILVGLEQLLPGGEDFNSWAAAIKDRMAASSMSIEAKKLAIQTACEMATVVATTATPFSSHSDYQSQYTMARLVAFLANEIPGLMASAVLPSLEVAHTVSFPQSNFQQKANLLMFFAELYTRLESELQVQELSGKKLPPLGEAVISQMRDFLAPNNVSDEGMKILLQVLKLAGRELDAVPTVYDHMNTLLSTLMGYGNGHPKLSESIKAQIKDIIDQRNKGWGPVKERTSPSVYRPDGTLLELNDDESRFLEECLEGESSSNFTNDPSDISLDDADVLNEFDSFLKEEDMNRTMNLIGNLSLKEEEDASKTPCPEESSGEKEESEKTEAPSGEREEKAEDPSA